MVKRKKVKRNVNKNVAQKGVKEHITCHVGGGGCGGCFYFLGFLGALVYYLSTATSFTAGVIGFLKAIVWPAFLVFELLTLVGA